MRSGHLVLLAALEYGGLVQLIVDVLLVLLAEAFGGAVDHDVGLLDHVQVGALDGDAGRLKFRLGLGGLHRVNGIALLIGGVCLVVGLRLSDSHQRHVVLAHHCVRDPLADGAITVERYFDLVCHQEFL